MVPRALKATVKIKRQALLVSGAVTRGRLPQPGPRPWALRGALPALPPTTLGPPLAADQRGSQMISPVRRLARESLEGLGGLEGPVQSGRDSRPRTPDRHLHCKAGFGCSRTLLCPPSTLPHLVSRLRSFRTIFALFEKKIALII